VLILNESNGMNTSNFYSHVIQVIYKGMYPWTITTPHHDASIWNVKILHETCGTPKNQNEGKVE
jgi:hypothetical protein